MMVNSEIYLPFFEIASRLRSVCVHAPRTVWFLNALVTVFQDTARVVSLRTQLYKVIVLKAFTLVLLDTKTKEEEADQGHQHLKHCPVHFPEFLIFLIFGRARETPLHFLTHSGISFPSFFKNPSTSLAFQQPFFRQRTLIDAILTSA